MSIPSEPLLVAEDLRVDVDGVPSCDGLAFETAGEKVLVLGAPRSLFEATCSLRSVVRGRLAIRGVDAGRAVAAGVVAGAPLDPPVPPKWTPLEYVVWSARLSGRPASDSRAAAKEALGRVELGGAMSTMLGKLSIAARRATVLAAAMVTQAEIVAVEDPTADLPEEIARAWGQILTEALSDRAWIVFAPRLSLTSPLALHAQDALVVTPSRLEAQGAPVDIAASSRRFVARLHGSLETLAPRLAERGATMEIQGAQVLVDLGESLGTAELVALCVESQVTVVELHPLSRALS